MKKTIGLLVLLSTQLLGCDSGQIPLNAVLTVAPSSKTFEIALADPDALCSYTTSTYQDVPLLFTLQTAEGSPIGDADLTIISDFTSTTFNGTPVLGLYDDANGNGVIDGPSELVSGSFNEGFTTQTSAYGGEKLIWARVYLGCSFSAEIFAYSGPISVSASITVVGRSGDETDDSEPDSSVDPAMDGQ